MNHDSVIDSEMQLTGPVCRLGEVSTPFENQELTQEQSDALGEYIRARSSNGSELLDLYRRELKRWYQSHNLEFCGFVEDEEARIEDRTMISPNFDFPEYKVKREDEYVIVKESLTCCYGDSRPKLWIRSQPDNRDSHEWINRELDHCKRWIDVTRERLAGFREFYRLIVLHLMSSKPELFKGIEESDVRFSRDHRFVILGIGSRTKMDDLIDSSSALTIEEFLTELESKQNGSGDLAQRTRREFQYILDLIKAIANLDDPDDNQFDFNIGINYPRSARETDGELTPVFEDPDTKSKRIGARISGVLSRAHQLDDFIEEYYVSLGYDSTTDKEKLKISTPAISSRGIMLQLGRFF